MECASEKSPVLRGRKDVTHLNKNTLLDKKNETKAVVVSGVANPSAAPALTALNWKMY